MLAPGLGVFALEVKGGRVGRENGVWYFTNRYGETNSRSRSPFEQAKDGVFSIIDAIKRRTDSGHCHVGNVLFGYGVMFPDIEFTASDIEEAQWQAFDSRDGKNVQQFIRRLSDGARTKWEALYGSNSGSRLPDSADVTYMASLLRGDFDCAVSLRVQLQNADNALIALTKEQYRCLDQLDDNPRCMIYGPAGTGKTLLAIEDVKKSVARGERVALFCFNSNLADWLSNYFAAMPDTLHPGYVGTFHKYMTQVAKKAGILPAYPRDPDKVQQFYQKDLPGAAASALLDGGEQFDKIVVDEAQDLICDPYLDVMGDCLRKGLPRGRWTMFGDFSMQAIYSDGVSGKEMIEKLEQQTAFIRFKLTMNCRNTKPICREIETITGFRAPDDLWTKVDGPPVQYITWSTMEEQGIKLKSLLERLADAQINPEEITILSPRKREDSVVSMLEGCIVKDFRVPSGMYTTFSTIQAYKGLENTVVILTDIEGFSMDKLMYVGLSRACSGLFILETTAAKNEYNSLLMRRVLDGK